VGGYPLLGEELLDPALVDHARRAAAAHPTFALLLQRERQPRWEHARPGPARAGGFPCAIGSNYARRETRRI
jgi:hypothetical protein